MKSQYKYVFYDPIGEIMGTRLNGMTANNLKMYNELPWLARPKYRDKMGVMPSTSRRFATEREAALFVDKWFLMQGRQPVNILKPKP